MSGDAEITAGQLDAATRARRRRRFLLRLGAVVLLLYLLAAYVIIPLAWRRDVHRHPQLFDAPRISHTPAGIPGDPVNLALLGSEA